MEVFHTVAGTRFEHADFFCKRAPYSEHELHKARLDETGINSSRRYGFNDAFHRPADFFNAGEEVVRIPTTRTDFSQGRLSIHKRIFACNGGAFSFQVLERFNLRIGSADDDRAGHAFIGVGRHGGGECSQGCEPFLMNFPIKPRSTYEEICSTALSGKMLRFKVVAGDDQPIV